MKSRGKQLMDLIENDNLTLILQDEWLNWDDEAEAKLNQFLEEQVDPRLKDAKNEVESLRMELRETRKVLQNAQEEICENELLLEQARRSDDDEGFGLI